MQLENKHQKYLQQKNARETGVLIDRCKEQAEIDLILAKSNRYVGAVYKTKQLLRVITKTM